MSESLVMTILGADRPGIVRCLAEAVALHGGNWLESRLVRLAGQFAGVVRVECPSETADSLIADLCGPSNPGLEIQIAREELQDRGTLTVIRVEVTGNDRPGIVRELAAAVASSGGNVEELHTGLESAPMSGHPLFRASGTISMPEGHDPGSVIAAIEKLSADLTVDVTE